jgi:phage shock protein A
LQASTRKKVEDIKVKDMKVTRLEKKEDKLVGKAKKAVDEGREKKADRLFGRAAKVENRVIKAKKK